MVPLTQIRVETTGSATYGALVAASVAYTARALSTECGPFDDADAAAVAVSDYARFLTSAGRHLELLLDVRSGRTAAAHQQVRALAEHVSGLDVWQRAGDSAWGDAGDQLRAAHDVLATHFGAEREALTPEARVVSRPSIIDPAVGRIVALTGEPLAVSSDLLAAAREAHATDVRLIEQTGSQLGRTLSPLATLLGEGTPSLAASSASWRLDALTAARANVGSDTAAVDVGSGLEAFRLLRQLAFGQSRGLVPANAHTLRDLCVLSSVTCRATEGLLPAASTPLRQLDRSATLEHLRRASKLWRELGGRLYPRVRGLAKAPGAYHAAVRAVLDEIRTNQSAAGIVLSGLPGLAVQAASTVIVLSEQRGLVSCAPSGHRTPLPWMPLDVGAGRRLAQGFLAAGRATGTANSAVRRQLHPRQRDNSLRSTAPSRTRSQSRRVSR